MRRTTQRPRATILVALASMIGLWGASAAKADFLYVGNYNGDTVSQISSAGVVSTYANSGVTPTGLAFDSAGNLFVGNSVALKITKIAPGGASSSTFASDLPRPEGLAFDTTGNLYVANYGTGQVSRITPAGAGSNFAVLPSKIGGLAFDAAGNLFVSGGNGTNSIYEVTPGGVVSTFASGGGLDNPFGLAFDGGGNLYVANEGGGGSVSRITPAGVVSTFASGGLLAGFDYGLAIDQAGKIFVSNFSNGTILRIDQDASVSLFASGLNGPTYLAISSTTVPEPSSLAMMSIAGAMGLAVAPGPPRAGRLTRSPLMTDPSTAPG